MISQHVYALLFFLMLIEGTGMPAIPFEPVFVLSGYFIEQGKVNFWLAVSLGTFGNFFGNLLGYWLGVKLEKRFLNGLFQRWNKKQKNLAAIKKWFERYGAIVIIVARWFGPIRTPTILGAGILGMPASTYAFYSLLGAFSWTLAWQYGCWKGTAVILHYWQYYHELCLLILVFVLTLALVGVYWYFYSRSGSFGLGKPISKRANVGEEETSS